ncbi:hypothetical protein VNO77_43718 [Canavalia gladiata]|uniref:Uncharacterized protein n=1 Tax=Canavalia gladiata TaxID=3824 RepID=A0AAN9JX91_CANGL
MSLPSGPKTVKGKETVRTPHMTESKRVAFDYHINPILEVPKMLPQKWFMLFFASLLIVAHPNGVEATQLLTIHRNDNHFKGYTKHQAYSNLGLVCKCCDGKGGECRSTWDAACSNLVCKPWKY